MTHTEGMTMLDPWPDVDLEALDAERHRRFTALLAELDLDHAVLTNFDAVRYATGLRCTVVFGATKDWYCTLVAADGETTLITVDVDGEDADPFPPQPWVTRRVPASSWQLFALQPEYTARVIAAELRRSGARRVGVEELQFEVMDAVRRELPDVELVPIKRELVRMRAVKMPDELRLIEAANAVGSHCMTTALEATRPGMTDHEVISVAVGEAFRLGVEWLSHQVLVVDGVAKRDTWFPRGHVLADGDTFIFDMGMYGQGGYAHDFCRTHFVGEPQPAVAEAHRALVECFREGVAIARPGVRTSTIHTTINDALVARGLPPTPYGMGHGIGLNVCEYPSITWPGGAETEPVLEEGMVICVEPSTYVESRGATVALKEEDVFVVEADGLRPITTTPVARP
jgi:Xaa-Pro dipeptidase